MTDGQVLYALALGLALVAWVGCYWALVILARNLVSLVKRSTPRTTGSSKPLNMRAVWTIDTRDAP
jgi:hypothetical protein